MNNLITLRVPRPDFDSMSDRVKEEVVQELSRQIAEQIYEQELARRREESVRQFKEYLHRWDVEILLAELKNGKSSTDTKEPE